ncbi:MAG: hypothetical protein ACPG4Y_10990, partial [Chitinophagales bacterium]
GKTALFKEAERVDFHIKPQPSFNKQFDLLLNNLNDNRANGLTNIIFYFPFRLFITHFKTNVLLIVSWFVLFMMIYGNILNSYGAYYLFLNPGYLGVTSYFSFLLLGVCFGIFFITWNIVSYLLLSYRYPFVASMEWPLAMYTFNNAILPLLFIIGYLYKIFTFQLNEMYASKLEISLYFL